jgi:transcriptional regulator with XRE-family HTH domain
MTIKELRLSTRMTQKQFAGYFNIPLRTIENWETGKRKPPEYVVELIRYRLEKEENMNRTKLLNEIKDNMYWENMFAHVWKEKNDYIVEFNVEDIEILDKENYIGKVNLSEWYWNDTDGFDIESKDKDVINYVNDCIAEELGI